MGGQACILYGGTEFSRDIAFASCEIYFNTQMP